MIVEISCESGYVLALISLYLEYFMSSPRSIDVIGGDPCRFDRFTAACRYSPLYGHNRNVESTTRHPLFTTNTKLTYNFKDRSSLVYLTHSISNHTSISMSRRPPNPAAERAAQNTNTIKSLLKLEGNKTCADCKRNKRR